MKKRKKGGKDIKQGVGKNNWDVGRLGGEIKQ